jgi:hypothetical protein
MSSRSVTPSTEDTYATSSTEDTYVTSSTEDTLLRRLEIDDVIGFRYLTLSVNNESKTRFVLTNNFTQIMVLRHALMRCQHMWDFVHAVLQSESANQSELPTSWKGHLATRHGPDLTVVCKA